MTSTYPVDDEQIGRFVSTIVASTLVSHRLWEQNRWIGGWCRTVRSSPNDRSMTPGAGQAMRHVPFWRSLPRRGVIPGHGRIATGFLTVSKAGGKFASDRNDVWEAGVKFDSDQNDVSEADGKVATAQSDVPEADGKVATGQNNGWMVDGNSDIARGKRGEAGVCFASR